MKKPELIRSSFHHGIDLGVGWGKTYQPYRVPDPDPQTDDKAKQNPEENN